MKKIILNINTKKLLLISCFAMINFQQITRGQQANLIIHEPNNESIVVYIEDSRQNTTAQSKVHINNLTPGSCKIRVSCGGLTIVEEVITLLGDKEMIYEVRKKDSYATPSHFLKIISVLNLNNNNKQTKATYQDVSQAIAIAASAIFEWHEDRERKVWIKKQTSNLTQLSSYECIPDQISALISVEGSLFDWHEEREGHTWLRKQITTILEFPTYKCDIPEKIQEISRMQKSNFEWHEEREARRWARKEIAALFN